MKIHTDIYIIIKNNKNKKGLIIKKKGKNSTKSFISLYFTSENVRDTDSTTVVTT